MVVALRRWWRLTSSLRVLTRSPASRLDSGSSNRKTLGSRTIARPTATRCRCPPESACGRRSEERGQAEGRGRLLDSALDLRPRQAAPLQTEGQVVAHVHVGVEGVGLEHHGDVAVLGGDVVHDPAVDREIAGGDALQPRDHPQDGGLAAPRGAEQDHELAVLHPEADVRDGRLPGPLEELRQSIQRDHRHGLPSPAST